MERNFKAIWKNIRSFWNILWKLGVTRKIWKNWKESILPGLEERIHIAFSNFRVTADFKGGIQKYRLLVDWKMFLMYTLSSAKTLSQKIEVLQRLYYTSLDHTFEMVPFGWKTFEVLQLLHFLVKTNFVKKLFVVRVGCKKKLYTKFT